VTGPRRAELARAQQWSAAVAKALDEVTDQVGSIARRLADGWPDARGREWSERLLVLHHALHREADAAADLGRAVGDVTHGSDADDGSSGYGPLLGGTAARRVDDRRGVTIPRLNDEADAGG
jgi:hypothetical protein